MDRRHPASTLLLLLAGALLSLPGCGAGAEVAPSAEVAPGHQAPCGAPGEPACAGEAAARAAPEEKSRQCEALIDVINQGLRALARIQEDGSDPTDPRDVMAMATATATAMDEVVATAARVPLTIPELQQASQEYRAMAAAVAKAAREMAAAAKAQDGAAIKAAQSAMRRAVVREDPLVDGLNELCKDP